MNKTYSTPTLALSGDVVKNTNIGLPPSKEGVRKTAATGSVGFAL